LVWAGLLAALALMLLAWTQSALLNGLLFGAAAGTLVLALLALLAREPRRRFVPDVSLPTVVTGVGNALGVAGVAVGTWLVLVGLGLTLVGLAAVVRELARA
jgi:hypothetical protein